MARQRQGNAAAGSPYPSTVETSRRTMKEALELISRRLKSCGDRIVTDWLAVTGAAATDEHSNVTVVVVLAAATSNLLIVAVGTSYCLYRILLLLYYHMNHCTSLNFRYASVMERGAGLVGNKWHYSADTFGFVADEKRWVRIITETARNHEGTLQAIPWRSSFALFFRFSWFSS